MRNEENAQMPTYAHESFLLEQEWLYAQTLQLIIGKSIKSVEEYEAYRRMQYSFEMPFLTTHDALEVIKLFHGSIQINSIDYGEIKYENLFYVEQYENMIIRNLDSGKPTYYLGIMDWRNNRAVVSPCLFLKYNYNIIRQYLINCLSNSYTRAIDFVDYGNLQIMCNRKINEYQSVVVNATFWLRLVQRHWKRVCLRRKLLIRKWKTIKMVKYKETHIHYPMDMQYLPGLKGLMFVYVNANK